MKLRRLLTLLTVIATVLVLIPSATAMPIDSKPDARPPARGYSRMIYEPVTGLVFMFGGFSTLGPWNADLHDVWVYEPNSQRWLLRWKSDAYFSPFNYDSLAYNSRAGKVIFFQPFAPGPAPDYTGVETWAYDLVRNKWTNLQPGVQPSMRWGSRMAYDARSDRIILFGGTDYNTNVTLADTWAYDCKTNTWTELHPAGGITPHHFFDMVYDSAADRIILFGGSRLIDGVWTTQNDTWAFDYDTNTWTERQPIASPSPRAYHSMAYDARTDQIIIFGGILSDEAWPNEPTINETWAYNYQRNTWTQLRSSTAPGERAWQTMIGTRDGMVMFGGGPNRLNYTAETWTFNARNEKWKLLK